MEPVARVGKVIRFDDPIPTNLSWLTHHNSSSTAVIIRPSVLDYLYKHAASEMQHEVGGYLLGLPYMDPERGWRATYIHEALRASYESTPTHVRMNPTSFREIEEVRTKTKMLLVGYYHSHPNLSIFQSGEDVRNFQMYYPENYQIAIVVDPSKTSKQSIYVNSSWIGYFSWDSNHKPIRLPSQQIFKPKEKDGYLHTPEQDASLVYPEPQKSPSIPEARGNQANNSTFTEDIQETPETNENAGDTNRDEGTELKSKSVKAVQWTAFGLALLIAYLLGVLTPILFVLIFIFRWWF